jgi:hypothetical protein
VVNRYRSWSIFSRLRDAASSVKRILLDLAARYVSVRQCVEHDGAARRQPV